MSKITEIFKKYPRTFWVVNTMELFERWAWYGMFMILALYLTGSTETGALGFSQSQKGLLMGSTVAILYFLPLLTGAIADKFGYKKVLMIAYGILSAGYLMMGFFQTYSAVFMSFIFLALGAALFKPVIGATIAKTTDDETSSIGFGIFYMMVNIGAFIGPIFASKLRGYSWNYVFIMATLVIILNFILVIFFYKEPSRKMNSDPLKKSITTVFNNVLTILKDIKFLIFLILVVGFWAMYNQFFYTLPNFIDQWMDTSVIYNAISTISPGLAATIGTKEGTIAPEMLSNIDALYIVVLQVFVSSLVMKLKPLKAITMGILVCSVGVGLMFMFRNPFFLFISILIFGLGEMSSSPKITEYIGKIAPRDKVALYIGSSYLPMAGGNFFAGILSGNVYQAMSDKITLLKIEVAQRGLSIPEITNQFTQNDYINRATELLHMDKNQLSNMLWEKYHPANIWMLFTGIGIFTVVGLVLYDRFILKKSSTMNNNYSNSAPDNGQ